MKRWERGGGEGGGLRLNTSDGAESIEDREALQQVLDSFVTNARGECGGQGGRRGMTKSLPVQG